jgi:hypothetical protein
VAFAARSVAFHLRPQTGASVTFVVQTDRWDPA